MNLAPGTVSADGTRFFDGDRWGWQPLWLSVTEVIDAVEQRYGIPADDADYLASGMLNQSWRVGDHVLRVSRPERTLEQIEYEHAVLATLHARVPEVPAPVCGVDGHSVQTVGGRRLTLFPYVDGELGTTVEPTSRRDRTATMMARVHRASLENIHLGQRPGVHASDVRSEWLWPRLAPMLRREVEGVDDCFALFDEETRLLEAWFDRVERLQGPWVRAVVQGDTNPRNLIFADGRIVAVIDWDDCRLDALHAPVAREAFASDPVRYWNTYLAAGGPLAEDSYELLFGFARLNALIELMWTDHDGRANPYSQEIIRGVAAEVETMRGRVPL